MKKIISSLAISLGLMLSSNAAMAEGSDSVTGVELSEGSDYIASYDIQFIDTMIEHHNQGIEIFKLAGLNAYSKKVRIEAQILLSKEQKDVARLYNLRSKVNSETPRSVNLDMPGMNDSYMANLRNKTGPDFDAAFLDQAIKHSDNGIKMGLEALEKAQNKDVRNKAQLIINEENRRIIELTKIQKAFE